MVDMEILFSFVQKLSFYFFLCFWLLCTVRIWVSEGSVVVHSEESKEEIYCLYYCCLTVYNAEILLACCSWC